MTDAKTNSTPEPDRDAFSTPTASMGSRGEEFLPPDMTPSQWEAMYNTLTIYERRTCDMQNAVLSAYASLGSLRAACEVAKVSYTIPNYWARMNVRMWNARLQVAQQFHREYLQDITLQRIKNPEGNRGSDILLMFRLNAEWPEKYRRDTVVIGGESARDLLVALRELGGRAREARAIEGKVVEAAGDAVLKRALGTASDDDKAPLADGKAPFAIPADEGKP